ncbi:MAG: Rpn family recombination-promoting nuclease/putative transposase [Blautia sp.]|nr:Rpn family recombination-promoting nuclease/putative transposase [Blautia sp.]
MVSLKYDFCFKQVMLNEVVRKHFISDVLGIPVERIRSAHLSNTFLWKRYARQKQGILDIRIDLDDGTRINIELQVRMMMRWDKRSLFYLAKMYTESLLAGEQYQKLKKCISINILDFSLEDTPSYHRMYRLRDENGGEFSDLFEVHVIELGKGTAGDNPLDEWIWLFNAKTEEELDMIRTKTRNPGIIEAIREIKAMGLRRTLYVLYEAHMKEVRDRYAMDEYVRQQGMAEGIVEGIAAGKANDILLLLSLKGDVSQELKHKIHTQKDLDTLNVWLTAAAQAESLEDFIKKAEI